MRRRIVSVAGINHLSFSVLDGYERVLYRRVLDQSRALLAVGVHAHLNEPRFDPSGRVPDWTFGHMTYERKNTIEHLFSRHPDGQGHPVEQWFVPRTVVEWDQERTFVHLHPQHEQEGLELVRVLQQGSRLREERGDTMGPWRTDTDLSGYSRNAEALLAHVRRGDIYEVNYCIRHSTSAPGWDPYAAFERLLQRSDAPYAAFYKDGPRYALCASPERFLAFHNGHVIGEPMKGTRPRSADPTEDRRLAWELATDPKERAENVMALDVMRHDLSRVAASRSVVVPELCGIRSYAAVHQMVSRVEATMAPGRTPYDVLLAAFPMASMTGAPKIRAMELIDQAEDQCRGLYSGTLGFFAPDGTGDFNVVIRAAFFDQVSGTLEVLAGSALTAYCDPAAEWEECALKARSVIDAIA